MAARPQDPASALNAMFADSDMA